MTLFTNCTKLAAELSVKNPKVFFRILMDTPLFVYKLHEAAELPVRADNGAAGYDIRALHDCIIPAEGRAIVPTGISIACPPGTYARIAPRSGLTIDAGLTIGAGVIDESYRGEIKIIFFNHDKSDYHMHANEKVAQLVLERIVTPKVVELDELSKTSRGHNGFGSTGM